MKLVVRPGWPSGLGAMALTVIMVVLVDHWSLDAPWITTRGLFVGVVMLIIGLASGSAGLVGAASVPMLGAALAGLDRPVGHAWGPALLLAILWYVATESAWASIDARTDTVLSPRIGRQRFQEVTTVVIVAMLVGLGGIALATLAPARTATVRALAASLVLVALATLGRHLTTRTSPGHPSTEHPTEPGGSRP